jgi:hypothetical protein
MDQQFALAVRVVASEPDGVGPGRYVRLKEPQFVLVNSCVRLRDLSAPFTQ